MLLLTGRAGASPPRHIYTERTGERETLSLKGGI